MSDGGEGAGALLAEATGGYPQPERACDPLGREIETAWWLAGDVAIVEMAAIAGIALLAPEERRAVSTSSFGVGQLLRAADRRRVRKCQLCVGGSANVDGGAGCLLALGYDLLDEHGARLRVANGGALLRIASIVPPAARPAFELTVLCDVRNPLLGPDGAAPTYAPQKGATAQEVALLDAGLEHWAALLRQTFGVDVSTMPGCGAAGGLPAAMVAAVGARLLPGAVVFAKAWRLEEKAAAADWIFTGEGQLDAQTLQGKVVSEIARIGQAAGRPVVAFVGSAPPARERDELARRLGLAQVVTISDPQQDLAASIAATRQNLTKAVARFAARRLAGGV